MNTINLKLMYAYINFKIKWIYNLFFCITTASRLVDLHGNSGRKRQEIPGHFGWKNRSHLAKSASALKTWPRPLRDAMKYFMQDFRQASWT
ncbi:TPA: hypothetical protein MIN48_22325 [Klebsiella pneumoniae]|nr:hypothetical protein [Klebsiella pneumoniae]